MAVNTLEALINGNANIVEYYNNGTLLWQQIKESVEFNDVNSLAQALTMRQIQFENQCGGRWLGQEIMVITGIGQFYSSEIGFDATYEDALKVMNAFAQSYCSIEVKWQAEKVAKIFYLTKNNEL